MKSSTLSWKAFLAKVIVAVMLILSVAVVPTTAKAAGEPTLTKSSRNILIGKTYNLNVVNKAKGSTYAWTTSDSSIATVDQKGIVKGKKAGQAVITCAITTPDTNYSLTCNVTVIRAAMAFNIKNKVSALNVGQAYDLNRTIKPSTSNDKTIWTSSDTTIAAPDKSGKFTALKEGTVTITGTTLSGKSDSVTIKVVGADGVVATQDDLNALLGTGVQKITLKTDAKVDFTIPSGQYTATSLVVDAPNADVHNKGVFAKIDIVKIAKNSWYEEAVGNLLNILADSSRVVVAQNAVVSIQVSAEGAKLVIENNGMVEEFVVEKPAEVAISGESEQSIPVVVNVPNVTLTTSVPLNLACEAKIDLVMLAGSEKSVVTANKTENVPAISGNVTVKVTVGTGETKKVETITGAPITATPTPPPVVVIPPTEGPKIVKSTSGNVTTFTLSQTYKNLKTIDVSYSGISYPISGDLLSKLKSFLAAENATVTRWQNTNDTTNRTYNGQNLKVTGPVGNTKTVTFVGGLLGGKEYVVTVNQSSNSVTVTSSQSNVTFTITKVSDTELRFESAVPSLYFSPSFY